jgi:putative flippase GtrA
MTMSDVEMGPARRLWRYYQAGIVNTAFGYGVYALLVSLGLWIYAAQLIAHLLGIAFNYFTYSRHVFHDASGSKMRFAVSYGFNYLLGLASLAAAAQVIRSPYVAGIVSILFVSFVNYFVLKHAVFVREPSTR